MTYNTNKNIPIIVNNLKKHWNNKVKYVKNIENESYDNNSEIKIHYFLCDQDLIDEWSKDEIIKILNDFNNENTEFSISWETEIFLMD